MLGENIYHLRKSKNLSQEKLAELVNVTRQTISNWELGETSPNPEQLKLLSKALHVSVDELINNDVKSVLVEKVSNTQALAGIIIKILKVLGLAFLIMLLVELVAFVLFIFHRTTNTTHQKTEVSVSCTKDDVTYFITVDTDGNYECKNCSNQMREEVLEMVDYLDLDMTVREVTNYFENINGSCE